MTPADMNQFSDFISEDEALGEPPVDWFWWAKRRRDMDPMWEQRLREHHKLLDLKRRTNARLLNLEHRTAR